MESIPVLVLFVITMAANLTGNMVRNYYSKSVSSTMAGYHLFNAATSLVCGVTLMLLSGGNFSMSPFTLGLAVLFGAVTATQQVATSAALNIGPCSYTSVIISMSTVITALSGALFFGESLRINQLIGIAMMLGCLALSVRQDDEEKKKTVRWFACCLIGCVCSAGVGLMQKIHQGSDFRGELTMFLIIAFVCSFVFSSVSLALEKKRGGGNVVLFDKQAGLMILLALFIAGGVGVALNNQINLYLSGVVASAVFFPIVNGGGLILITAASVVLFREKLTARQWLGLALGIVATLLLCI
jgi:drug/metabolite transporter (DMT)-like permease